MDKKLLRYPGGQPLRSQDIELLEDALNGTIVNLAKAYGDTYILYGAVDASRNNVIKGAVVIGGEIYSVPALGPIGDQKLCYRIVDSDERRFFNGEPHKVVRTYEAYLSADTSGAVAFIDLKTAKIPTQDINKRLDNIYINDLKGWSNIELASDITGKAEYIYPFWGVCAIIRIDISFTSYNQSADNNFASLFAKSLPINFTSQPVCVNKFNPLTGVFAGIIVGLDSSGRLSSTDGVASFPHNPSGYSIKTVLIVPVNLR